MTTMPWWRRAESYTAWWTWWTWPTMKLLSWAYLGDTVALYLEMVSCSCQMNFDIPRHNTTMFVRTIHIVSNSHRNGYPNRCNLSCRRKNHPARFSPSGFCKTKFWKTICKSQRLIDSLLKPCNGHLCVHCKRLAVAPYQILITYHHP